MKIAISLLVHNDLFYLKPMIDSLFNSDLNQYEYMLFIVDNNSNQELKNYINELPYNKFCVYNNTNEGIVIPRITNMNKILEGDYDYTIEIHSDMLFPKVWLNSILDIMTNNLQICIGMPFILNNPNILLNINELEELTLKHKENIIYENARQVHPWVLNNNIVKKIGYYDSIFSPRYCEDDDFMYNVIKNGYKIIATKQSIVLHYGGKTQEISNLPDNLQHNFNLFKEKNNISVQELISMFTLHPVISNY
jgi:GT2 family glycosyltransferase